MSRRANRAIRAGALAAALALGHPQPAGAACPAPTPGAALPPEAQPEMLDNAPWRARVAALEQAQSTLDLAAVQVLFLGDSITEAWDSAIFAHYFGDLRALNWGARGETTQGLLWRLPRMPLGAALRPKLIVLLIGTNDTWPGGNPRSAAIGVGEVVSKIHQMAPDSRILLLGILPRGPTPSDPWRQMAMGMNNLIAACADQRSVFYVNPGSHLLDASGLLSITLATDFLHPTPKGYAILAAALSPSVRKLVAK